MSSGSPFVDLAVRERRLHSEDIGTLRVVEHCTAHTPRKIFSIRRKTGRAALVELEGTMKSGSGGNSGGTRNRGGGHRFSIYQESLPHSSASSFHEALNPLLKNLHRLPLRILMRNIDHHGAGSGSLNKYDTFSCGVLLARFGVPSALEGYNYSQLRVLQQL